MPSAYVLMTAMPPTKGHFDLIRYAAALGPTTVIVNTQPDEPMWSHRVTAIKLAVGKLYTKVRVVHIHKTLPQEPEGNEGFWEMWGGFLREAGFWDGDFIVGSEMYGVRLAQEVNGIFMPYDLNRSIRYTKAQRVRENYRMYWDDILPEFRRFMKKEVTIYGAESTGKTTTARKLARAMPNTTWLPEWARPYMEKVVTPDITVDKMTAIMRGQWAMESAMADDYDFEFLIRDTDLLSTLGYWEFYSPETVPDELYVRVEQHKADLYLMMMSNIPYEPDPLRYGKDHREIDDKFWIELLERYDCNFKLIEGRQNRVIQSADAIYEAFPGDELKYQRIGAEYELDISAQ